MRKISLILAIAALVSAMQTVNAQTVDSTKNHVEIKKKVKTGVHGRQVTKIKMKGTGTEGTLSGAADGTVTGKLPNNTPPSPTVVVVAPQRESKPEAPATPVTTTTETKTTPVTSTSSTSTRTSTSAHVVHSSSVHKAPVHTYHHVYRKTPAVAASTKTTTTTTVNKNE